MSLSMPDAEVFDSRRLRVVNAELRRRELSLCEDSLRTYVGEAWQHIEPGTTFIPNWHIDAICDHLQAVSDGDIKRLIINIPPRCMKSLTVSVMWPTWDWITRPARKWLFSSYAQSLSTRDSLKCRRLIQSEWYNSRWGDRFQLTRDQYAKIRFENSAFGYRIATSVTGMIIGEGGDIVVVDDPHNTLEAESELVRNGVLDWWDMAMSTRLNSLKDGAFVIIMQRLHEADLSGHILANELGWDHLMLPMRYEPSHPHALTSSLGFTDPREDEGELLWPERVGDTELVPLEQKLGAYAASGQLQQRPSPAGGGIFQRQWFRYFADEGDHYKLRQDNWMVQRVLKADCWIFFTVDMALTTKTTSDYSVIQVWAVEKIAHRVTPTEKKVERSVYADYLREDIPNRGGNMMLIDQWRDRAVVPTVENMIRTMMGKWKPVWVGIEDRHVGSAVIQRFVADGLPIVKLKDAGKDKVTRASMGSVWMENGKVYFPESNPPWLADLEHELELFDHGDHDDQVDCLSYAAAYSNQRNLWKKPTIADLPLDSMGKILGMDKVLSPKPEAESAFAMDVKK